MVVRNSELGGPIELITLPLSLFCTDSRRDGYKTPSLGAESILNEAPRSFSRVPESRENFRTVSRASQL